MEPGWKAPVDTRPLKPEKVLKAFEAQIQISELGDQLSLPASLRRSLALALAIGIGIGVQYYLENIEILNIEMR